MKGKEGNKKGFTLVEVVVAIAVVALLAGILVPLISKNIEDSKKARAKNEAVVIAAAIGSLYKDVGWWPTTDSDGPTSSPGVDRILTDPSNVPTGTGTGAGSGAKNWGTYGSSKPLADYLFYNNPDGDTGSSNQNQASQDYPTSGDFKWDGPYVDRPTIQDPWGNSYVINARYLPSNPRYKGSKKHRVYVLSAGPNRVWETPYSDATGDGSDSIQGDDIGVVLTVR